jgi:N-acetylglucosaminyl-diphospho-decaprenol L-rhamnosyltransferase
MNQRVCAIVLDYFGADKTKQSVLSLVGQDLETVYILDNSGSDSASANLRHTFAELTEANTGFKIKSLTAGKNLGFGRGINFVLAHDRRSESPHDYYLLLNNDAVAGPGLVATMLGEFQKDPAVALVAPRILSEDPAREFGIWYHRYFGLLLPRAGQGRFHYFTGCCLLFRKDLVTDSGIFDESFFMYGEDVELGWRLNRQGKKMICATGAFVKHELGPSASRTGLFYEYHMARSHLLLSLKTRFHSAELPVLLLGKYTGLSCRAAIRCFRYRALTPLAGFLLAWFPLRMKEVPNWVERISGLSRVK